MTAIHNALLVTHIATATLLILTITVIALLHRATTPKKRKQ